MPNANVIAPVLVMFISGNHQFDELSVIVPVTAPVLSNTAVSWANGKLLSAGAPPDDKAHAVAFQF